MLKLWTSDTFYKNTSGFAKKKGQLHLGLIDCQYGSADGYGNGGSLCNDDNNQTTAIIGWQEDDIDLIQLVAHEIGHVLGMDHDFEANEDDVTIHRNVRCGAAKWEGGEGNYIMNYGEPTLSEWSKCSNIDFANYYQEVLRTDGKFCLEESHVIGMHFIVYHIRSKRVPNVLLLFKFFRVESLD